MLCATANRFAIDIAARLRQLVAAFLQPKAATPSPIKFKDCYETLEVRGSATQDEVKRAYLINVIPSLQVVYRKCKGW